MAGIYIHIPFCRKVCFYCDFHFTVSLKNKEKVLESIEREMELRKNYTSEKISTIYLGGGTPSVLDINELKHLFGKIYSLHEVDEHAEITIETNPDDLNETYLVELKNETPVNRLSVGIQSFHDKHLIWMNRRHGGEEAVQCIERAQRAGFTDINADLIYGLPGMTMDEWKNDVLKMISLDIPHISAYHLTIEPNTILGRRHKKGFVREINEKQSFDQFNLLIGLLKENGYEHYEISNFAKPGFYSKHNTNYWKQQKYAGFGPSAHSYNGKSRQWNIKVNARYIEKVNSGKEYFEKEDLGETDRYNEYVMLSLRTMWGCDLNYMKENMDKRYIDFFVKNIENFIRSGHVECSEKKIFTLTLKGKFIADHIAGELFYEE